MKRALLLILLVANINFLYSQELETIETQVKDIKYDTTRITDLSDQLNLYTGFFGKFHSIELDHSELGRKVKLEPNGKTSLGLGFNYKWLGLGFNFSPGFLNKDDNIYGESNRFDTQLNIYIRSFGVDAYVQYYKGFYLKNPNAFIDWTQESFPLRPDLETFSLGLSGYYFTNSERFSYKAAFTRNQIQKKSAGSLILGAYLNANIASAPGGILPTELPDSLSNYFNIDGFITSTLGVSVGYTYTFAFKRFFINTSLVPGLGFRNAEIWEDNISTKLDGTITGSATIRIALGYEGRNIYAGINMVSTVDTYEYELLSISSSTGNVRFVIGKRFNTKKLFKRKEKQNFNL